LASHKKGATGRDFKAEYAARKSRGLARGLSVKQARGHTGLQRGGEGTVLGLRATGLISGIGREQSMLARKRAAVAHMYGGETLAHAAQVEGISPSTLRRFIKEQGIARPAYSRSRGGRPARIRSYGLFDRYRAPILAADGTFIASAPMDRKTASLLGRYWQDVVFALEGHPEALDRYRATTVYTLDGRSYRLMTDLDTIRAWLTYTYPDGLDDLWRNFQSEELSNAA
jgi:hypothetical protein